MSLREPLTASTLRATLRLLLKPALSPRLAVPRQRAWLEALSAIARLPRGMLRRDADVAGVPVERWEDPRARPCRDGSLLFLHGGGYCVGSPRTHRALAAWLARDSGLPVVVPHYRLAPGHPFPAALDDALAVYDALAAQGPVVIAGDSAGGGLALALAVQVRDSGRPAPAGLALLSPWVDLRPAQQPPAVPGEAMLTAEWMQACAGHYAGSASDDPRVSPLLADLRGLPPVIVQCGTDELLCTQSRALAEALTGAGVRTTLEVAPHRWHVFQIHAGLLPSANAAVSRIARFVQQALDAVAAPRHAVHDLVILGAGMSGLCMAMQLQKAGRHDFVILEQQPGLGGTWWDNRYPGAQVDVPAPAYAFSFAANARWSQRFANAPEIHAYQLALAEKHGLFARLRLGTRLSQARFEESTGLWHLRTANGDTLVSRYFVCSTGPLSQPSWPDIPGLEDFQGLRLHSARWDYDKKLAGLRVAVIGTGSTAVQLIPPIAREAARLHVFQRTANWVLPRLERRYRWFDKALASFPPYAIAVRASWVQFLELGRRGFEEGTFMRWLMLKLAARQRRQGIADPALRAALTPDYPLGCKRIIYSNDYYPALSRANVELVTAPIERLTRHGIRTADGNEREVDALVCATGFETVHLLQSLTIQGRGGRTLAEAWQEGPDAYHGISVAGFPNLFLMLGPNTATGHTSTLLFIEPAVQHAIACMRAVEQGGHRTIEVRAEVQQAHNAALQQRLGSSVWSQCRSWYRMEDGKVIAIFPGFVREYVRAVRQPVLSDYRLDAAERSAGSADPGQDQASGRRIPAPVDSMKKALGALLFYGRFAIPFSRIGFRRRVGEAGLDADFSGQRWLVSGATGGIGRAIALGAAGRGATVLALGRDASKLDALVASATGPGTIQPVPVDLSLMGEVSRVAREVSAAGTVDVLVHNVGVMRHGFRQTAEGLEEGFATNLLGHWLLDAGLRRGGALTADSAIISMSSGGMYGAALDLDALQADEAAHHDGFTAYAQHKRAQVELTHHWNQLGDGQPKAWVMHPGWVDTDGVRTALPGFRKAFRKVLRTPQDGADTALWLAHARPDTGEGIWLDRHRDTEHAFGFTRNGATAGKLASHLAAQCDLIALQRKA